jgi:DNA gyrase subunit A
MGVRGIRLREGDEVVSAASSGDGDQALILTSGGYGKRTKITEFPAQKRGGIGVKAIKLTRVRGHLVSGRVIAENDEIFVTSSNGIVIRTAVDGISRQRRDATGVKVMNLPKGATVTAMAKVPRDEVGPSEAE